MKFVQVFLFFSLAIIAKNSSAQSAYCNQAELPFAPGEYIKYNIQYNLGFLWFDAASVSFSVEDTVHENQHYYHLSGKAKTNPRYDWIFKVTSNYHSYLDTNFTLQKFDRKGQEGHLTYDRAYNLKRAENRVYIEDNTGENEERYATLDYEQCAFDVISMVYYARTIDYDNYTINDSIPIQLLLDKAYHDTYIRYLGNAEFEDENGKIWDCIKFSPYLIEGTVFKGGEGMEVYVTNDKYKIPIYIEAEVLVGSIKTTLSSFSGLK